MGFRKKIIKYKQEEMSETEWKMIPGYPRYEMNISTLQVRVIKSGRVLSTRGGAVTISRNAKYICLSLPKLLFFVDRNIEPSTDAVKDVIMTNENGRIVVYEKSEYMSQKIQEVYAIKRTIPAIEVYTRAKKYLGKVIDAIEANDYTLILNEMYSHLPLLKKRLVKNGVVPYSEVDELCYAAVERVVGYIKQGTIVFEPYNYLYSTAKGMAFDARKAKRKTVEIIRKLGYEERRVV